MKTLYFAIVVIGFMTTTVILSSISAGHQCEWPKCPYKGVHKSEFNKAVTLYVGNQDSDAYYLGILHLQFPTATCEQLEDKLFDPR